MFLLSFCCKLVLAQSVHSISLPLAESLVLDHYGRQKYCLWETAGLLHFINWMVSESLLIWLCFKKKMGKYICPTSGFLIRGKRRWTRRERALCLSSKQNKLPWIKGENETEGENVCTKKVCCTSLLNYSSPFLWHKDVFCEDLFLPNVYNDVGNVSTSVEVSSINILLFIMLCWERYF